MSQSCYGLRGHPDRSPSRSSGTPTSDTGGRELRELAAAYTGNWRDILVFVCAVLFTIVWWNVSHSRTNWTVMFVVMILLSIVAAFYAARGALLALRSSLRKPAQ